MADPRPKPVRLNAVPRTATPKPKSPKRPRDDKPRRPKGGTTYLTWTAIILLLLLVGLLAVYFQIPAIKTYLAKREEPITPPPAWPAPLPVTEPPPVKSAVTPPVPPPEAAVVPPPAPPKPTREEMLKKIKERADEETRHLVERQVPASELPLVKPPAIPAAQIVPPPVPPAPSKPVASQNGSLVTPGPSPAISEANPLLPPIAPPASTNSKKATPAARALPVDPNKLDTERIAAYQVALERLHFSCGFIDGDLGMRSQRMLRAFQTSRDLPVTGVLDEATRNAIGEPGEPFLTYTVTKDDVASIMAKPATWKEKSQAKTLGYNSMWEMLGEKFHCARGYLKSLNPNVKEPVAGTEIVGPKVYPAAPTPKVASLKIYLSETEIEAIDPSGKIVGFFPCSIAKDKEKRPHGLLTVKVVDPHPDYTFDPALFADAAKAEGLTHKMSIPPGPRNPVGTTWIGLSLPGYGIHGTPEPENISRTQSHGCFRLANWNAEQVLKMVKVGTPVDVEP